MQAKLSFLLLATAALSAAAGIPGPNEADLEKKETKSGSMTSPGYRDGGDGNKFAWSRCVVTGCSDHFPCQENGKMVTGDLSTNKDDKDTNHWCWLTLDGSHRVKKEDGDGDAPDLGPSTDGAYPGSKYSCLTYGDSGSSDRKYHGGCFYTS